MLFRSIKKSGEVVGIKSRLRVKKSKLAPPFTEATIAIMYDGTVRELDEDADDAE